MRLWQRLRRLIARKASPAGRPGWRQDMAIGKATWPTEAEWQAHMAEMQRGMTPDEWRKLHESRWPVSDGTQPPRGGPGRV
jgi:hypothetical protein